MQTSESIKSLAEALAKAQADIKHAVRNAKNEHFRRHYADLSSVVDACRKPLAQHGLAVVHGLDSSDGQAVTVTCRLIHLSGEWIQSSLTLRPTKPDAQGIGSAATYGRRFTLAALAGIATDDDDDGNDATTPQAAPPNRPVAQQTRQQPTTDDDGNALDVRAWLVGEVSAWAGVQREDLPAVMRSIKKALKIDTNTDASPADMHRMLAFVRECVAQGKAFTQI